MQASPATRSLALCVFISRRLTEQTLLNKAQYSTTQPEQAHLAPPLSPEGPSRLVLRDHGKGPCSQQDSELRWHSIALLDLGWEWIHADSDCCHSSHEWQWKYHEY